MLKAFKSGKVQILKLWTISAKPKKINFLSYPPAYASTNQFLLEFMENIISLWMKCLLVFFLTSARKKKKIDHHTTYSSCLHEYYYTVHGPAGKRPENSEGVECRIQILKWEDHQSSLSSKRRVQGPLDWGWGTGTGLFVVQPKTRVRQLSNISKRKCR